MLKTKVVNTQLLNYFTFTIIYTLEVVQFYCIW